MADFKILCPACASVLSSKKPISNGKKITCPHCHKPFVAATSDPGSSSDSGSLEFDLGPPAAPSGRSSPRHDAPKSHEKPAHAGGHHAPVKSGSRGVLLWLLVIGLVILAGAGGAAGMYFFMQQPEPSLSQKHKGKGGESKDGADAKTAAALPKPKIEKKKDAKKAVAQENQGGAAKEDGVKQVAAADPTDAPNPNVAPKPAVAKPKVAEWTEFKSAKGGFTAQFPAAKPEEFQERDEDIIFYGTRTEVNGFDYEITFHRLKKDDLATPPTERLKKIADEAKSMLITKREDVEIKGVPKASVLELTVFKNDKKDVAVERWLVYKDHVFQIVVTGDKSKIGPDQVSRFMESFRFVADPQGDFLDLTKTTGIPPERKKK